MKFIHSFLTNHVLANLTFVLVLVLGALAFNEMPRAKDPEINFNWINILTTLPGASASDIERRITDQLEDAIRTSVQDIKFVSSTSRDGISNILVRFNQMDERTFDKRVIDLRREIQNTYNSELPDEAEAPYIYEVTTSNAFPSASIVVSGLGDDENLRVQAHNIVKDIERIKGVFRADPIGLPEPELHVAFKPERLHGLGITPADLADTVRAYFKDISAGDLVTDSGQWIVRLEGTDSDPSVLSKLPIITANGVVELGNLANIYRTTEEANEIVRYKNNPAIFIGITKQANANVLKLVSRVNEYVEKRNEFSASTGAKLSVIDDQTISTRRALSIMQTNAMIGLGLVLLVTWIFLGTKISLLTSIGIPFTLAGTFLVLNTMDLSLNNTVLLGTVIALGMLVDDAVVVVEAIYQRIQQGIAPIDAAIPALKEVVSPVTTSVLTTMAAFLPLMLLPGILGEFLKMVPLVVTIALAVSLIEAYWMLPAHVMATKPEKRISKTQEIRIWFTQTLRRKYVRTLLKVLRYRIISMVVVLLIFGIAVFAISTGQIKLNFFAADPIRLFYVNIEMPAGSSMQDTLDYLYKAEEITLKQIDPNELRDSVIYAGQQFTETEPLFGENVGQVLISLKPDGRSVLDVADDVEAEVTQLKGPKNVSMTRLTDGPPTSKPINIKVRGDSFEEIQAAANALIKYLKTIDAVYSIDTDFREGNPELVLRYDGDAIKRAGLNPETLNRSLEAYVDGELITAFQDNGEEVKVRVIAEKNKHQGLDQLLRQTIALPDGNEIPLSELAHVETRNGMLNIRHYNFKRTITVQADINKEQIDTVTVNNMVQEHWNSISQQFPNNDLDFSGELDDIDESIGAIKILFALGIGIIYVILGTQFRSYFQPFMILATVPLAFTGVVFGLLATNNPLSLYTMYGIVALAGISVNAAIVLISAANSRLNNGMSVIHATVYAARRRVIPIVITSLTTVAGLFSLATGLAGHSLIWGPVATAIVWGLAFSTILTLFVIPLLYQTFTNFRPIQTTRSIWAQAIAILLGD